ncbi:transporter associated domain-containing protein [Aureimonas populi]|uniref:Transporter associated domain-containing protein n=1 Tax=Aureimonas populi TaxID=1701758 RepID=A0ABW5CPZ9_9HYPH|nr:hemolysin family protein [Aureimonas populi]
MSTNANGAVSAGDGREAGESSFADQGQDDRSPVPAERTTSEPGFFEQIVQFLKPRAPSPLRQSFAEALRNAEIGASGFTVQEQAMLTNLLGLHETRVEDAMVPRVEIDAVEVTASLGDTMRRFEESGRSRMPVYGEGLDDPKGMIHIRDVVGHITRRAMAAAEGGALDLSRVDLSTPVAELGLIRKILFVPASMPATELMARMQATRIQMALVIDEYGGTDGLVSLEDIIETIVGDIEDEHDEDEVRIVAGGEGVYEADARAELEDVQKVVGGDFDIAAYEDEADTIGGLVVAELGRIPAEGETVETLAGFRLEVLEADTRRVKRVRIVRRVAEPPSEAASLWN